MVLYEIIEKILEVKGKIKPKEFGKLFAIHGTNVLFEIKPDPEEVIQSSVRISKVLTFVVMSINIDFKHEGVKEFVDGVEANDLTEFDIKYLERVLEKFKGAKKTDLVFEN